MYSCLFILSAWVSATCHLLEHAMLFSPSSFRATAPNRKEKRPVSQATTRPVLHNSQTNPCLLAREIIPKTASSPPTRRPFLLLRIVHMRFLVFFSFHYTSFVFLLHRNPVPCPVDTGGGWDMVVSIRARLPAWVGLPSVMLT